MLRYIKLYIAIFFIISLATGTASPSQTDQCNETLYNWAVQSHREFWTLLGKMAGYESHNEETYQYVKSHYRTGLNYIYIDKTNQDPDYVFKLMKNHVSTVFFKSDNEDMMFKYITVLHPADDHVAMSKDLRTLNTNRKVPNNIKIWEVSNDEEFKTWVQTTITRRMSSATEATHLKEYFKGFLPSKKQNTKVKFYLGSINGKVVGSSAMYYGKDFVSLYWVGVHPDFRRQGLGSALTYVPLQHAKTNGYRWCVLQAQPLGAKVYPLLGFQKLGIIKVFYYIPRG